MASDYSVRLLEDGPSSWANSERWRASEDQPIITGLSESQANYLVENHPFEEHEGDPEMVGVASKVATDVSGSDDTVSAQDSDTSAESVDAPFDPSSDGMTVSDVSDKIQSGDYSDAELDALAAAEADGKDRDGVADAIDEARDN